MITREMRERWLPAAIGIGLLVLSLWAFRETALTNRVLARGDAFAYFTPYWAYRAEALRAGRIPLWNPYLFLGAPFLANPQTAVFYPLHWPLIWLPAHRALIWSMVIHTWLGACGAYALARRWGVSRWGAWLSAMTFSMGGVMAGHAGQINQLNAMAWLPAALLATDVLLSSHGRMRLRYVAALSMVLSMQFLAGHTQTFYISAAAIGVYTLLAWMQRWRADEGRPRWSIWGSQGAAIALAIGLTIGIVAVQLSPTRELTQLSIRTGGLSYREAIAFSLSPRDLLLALLPPYGAHPAAAMDTPAFGEFMAYMGIAGLWLALVGALAPLASHRRAAHRMTAFSLIGLALALGGYTPLYPVLYTLVPGFNLFRVPARWLLWYATGASVLAGMGLDRLTTQAIPWNEARRKLQGWIRAASRNKIISGLGALAFVLVLLLQRSPGARAWLAWVFLGLLAVVPALSRHRTARAQRLLRLWLMALTFVELTLGAWVFDFNHPTAPEAVTSLRTAPAHLLASPGRFLSMSGIQYDPGDLPEMRQMLSGLLDPDAFNDFVTAAKLKEIIAPNLPLLWHIPSIDGYDGGVLPLARYVWFQTLFIPEGRLIADGRLREQLDEIPPARLLDLSGIRYVITDKVRDLWIDGIYYDLQGQAPLAGERSVTLESFPSFSVTAVGVISYLDPPLPDTASRVGEIWLEAGEEPPIKLDIRSEIHTDDGRASRSRARLVYHDSRNELNYYLAVIPLPRAMRPERITLRSPLAEGRWVVRGITLIDERTRQFVALPTSEDGRLRRVHSGDVKIYELSGALGRAYIAGRTRVVADEEAAIQAIADWGFDPRDQTILIGGRALDGPARAGTAMLIADRPEQVVIEAHADAEGYLVLSDADYPGWEAYVDGEPAPIVRANFLFRAVYLTPGEHIVLFRFRPPSFWQGLRISVVALLLWGAILATGMWPGREVR